MPRNKLSRYPLALRLKSAAISLAVVCEDELNSKCDFLVLSLCAFTLTLSCALMKPYETEAFRLASMSAV